MYCFKSEENNVLFLFNESHSSDYNLHKYWEVSCNSSVNIGELINHLRLEERPRQRNSEKYLEQSLETIEEIGRRIVMMTSDMIRGLQFCAVINFTKILFTKLSAFYSRKRN